MIYSAGSDYCLKQFQPDASAMKLLKAPRAIEVYIFAKRVNIPDFVCCPQPVSTKYKSARRILVLKDCQICNLTANVWCRWR